MFCEDPLPLLIPFLLCYFFSFPLFQGKQPALLPNSAAEPCLVISYRGPSLHSPTFLLLTPLYFTSLNKVHLVTEHTNPLIISEIILCLPPADLGSNRSKLFFLNLKYRLLYLTVSFWTLCQSDLMTSDDLFIYTIKFLSVYYRYQDWHRKILKAIARLTTCYITREI